MRNSEWRGDPFRFPKMIVAGKAGNPPLTSLPVNFPGFLFFAFVCAASAQGDGSALGALRLLPRDAAKRLARIEAREGAPVPERWYFLVHAPEVARGLREFAVADGRVAANRTLSQFADSLQAADVVGADSVKCDSDQVARLAALFAMANEARIGAIHYELARDAAVNGPVWRATVFDPNGDPLGVLVITAAKGAIVSHDGFEKEPAPELIAAAKAATVAASGRSAAPRAAIVRLATPSPTPKPNLFKRIFGANGEKPAKAPR